MVIYSSLYNILINLYIKEQENIIKPIIIIFVRLIVKDTEALLIREMFFQSLE